MAQLSHRWKFHRVGGLEQVSITTGDDLAHLPELDQKLWTALSCPTHGLELDAKTLELLDLDGDGRVRAPEILAAIAWCVPRLERLESLLDDRTELPLAALSTRTPEGKALAGAARRILTAAGKIEATAVAPEDVADVSHVFDGTDWNGDGIVPAEAAGEDVEARQLILDAMACVGSKQDRSGRPGIDQALLDAFFAALQSFAAWWAAGDHPSIQALGPATEKAWKAVEAVRAKVDDYFARCRLVAYDPRSSALLDREGVEGATAVGDPSSLSVGDELRKRPIARAEAGRPLPLQEGINPAWSAAMAALATDAVAPFFGPGRTALTASEWESLVAKVAPYAVWQADRKGIAVERLGIERVRALLGGKGRLAVEALLVRDRAVEPEALAIGDVVRLVHYHRDLYTLLRNFVSFADFYDPARPAVFQAGTLYLDARSCDLCIRVDDPIAHATLAAFSRMYIAYCECKRRDGAVMKIAACFTQGDSDYLMVGRNGIFYDRQGGDWDATIVKIVDNPISIRQAFFAPYKKFLRMIEEQVARFAAAKEKEAEARLAATATGAVGRVTGTVTRSEPPVDIGKMVGLVAAIGVGVGALGTLFGGLVSGFISLQPWWSKLAAVFGALMAISGPSMCIAWLKLRQRNLGPVLDANGWAVNGRVQVNLPLGSALTSRAVLPSGAIRSLKDPYEDKAAVRRRRIAYALGVMVIAALAAARYLRVWPFAPWR